MVTLYDVHTGDEVTSFNLGERVKNIVLSPIEGDCLAVITPEHLSIHAMPSFDVKSRIEWNVCNPTVAISSDCQYVVVGGRNTAMWKAEAGGVLQLLFLDTLESIYVNDSLQSPVDNVAFSPRPSSSSSSTTSLFLVAAQEHGLSIYSVPDMMLVRLIRDAVYSIRELIFLSTEILIQANGKEITAFTTSAVAATAPMSDRVKIADDVTLLTSTLALSPSNDVLVSGGEENSIRVFEATTWRVLKEVKLYEPIVKLCFVDDHTLIAVLCTGDMCEDETPTVDVLTVDVKAGQITRRVNAGTGRFIGVVHISKCTLLWFASSYAFGLLLPRARCDVPAIGDYLMQHVLRMNLLTIRSVGRASYAQIVPFVMCRLIGACKLAGAEWLSIC